MGLDEWVFSLLEHDAHLDVASRRLVTLKRTYEPVG
jgi:hypothetical protein